MIRIDAAYIYKLGGMVRPVADMEEKDTSKMEYFMALSSVTERLENFLYNSIFNYGFKSVFQPAKEFLDLLKEDMPELKPGTDWKIEIPSWKIGMLKKSFADFEAVLIAELQTSDLYYVMPKSGFDVGKLTESGEKFFHDDLALKVPEALSDIRAAMRCIAFELPTAAGFHLHRANEAVLRRYWDSVASGASKPTQKNMGVYLKKLEEGGFGKKEVIEHLKSIKDFHRNPLMHPDQSLDSVDQAIDLWCAIRCSIGYMLNEIEPIIVSSDGSNLPVG